MPKSLFIDPVQIRKKGKISFSDIPVNQYSKTIEDEKSNFSKDDFTNLQGHDNNPRI